jgi:hypothetical protein
LWLEAVKMTEAKLGGTQSALGAQGTLGGGKNANSRMQSGILERFKGTTLLYTVCHARAIGIFLLYASIFLVWLLPLHKTAGSKPLGACIPVVCLLPVQITRTILL